MFTPSHQSAPVPLIVHEDEPLTLLGGASVSMVVLNNCLSHAPTVVAADGGADRCLAAGLRPLAVIGDMDSISVTAATAFADVMVKVSEQISTDFEKALTRLRAPVVLAVGFLGGRLDHQMAVLNVLVRYTEPVILVGDEDVVVVVRDRMVLDLVAGMRLALLPLEPVQVTTRGLVWNLDAAILAPTDQISSSNRVASGRVTITAQGPVVLTLPLAGLDAVIAAVRAGQYKDPHPR